MVVGSSTTGSGIRAADAPTFYRKRSSISAWFAWLVAEANHPATRPRAMTKRHQGPLLPSVVADGPHECARDSEPPHERTRFAAADLFRKCDTRQRGKLERYEFIIAMETSTLPPPPNPTRRRPCSAARALVCSASRCWRRARPPLPAYARLLAVACTLSAWLLLGFPRSDEGEIGPILDQLPGRCARGRRAGRSGRVEGPRRILWSRDIHAMVCQVRRLSTRILPRGHPNAPATAFSGPRVSGRPDLTVCEPVHAKSRRRERDPRVAPFWRWGAHDQKSSITRRWAHHTERP